MEVGLRRLLRQAAARADRPGRIAGITRSGRRRGRRAR
jgi:hypothetical protein